MNETTRRHLLVAISSLLVALAGSARAEEVSPGRRAAAKELVGVMDLEAQLLATLPLTADIVIQSTPAMARYRDVINEWAKTYITWEKAEPRFIDIYATSFSEAELRDLIVFYKTPTGKRSLAVMPQIMQQSMAVGREIATPHGPDLMRMIGEYDAAHGKGDGANADGAKAPGSSDATPPAPLTADDRAQRLTTSDIRNVGTAMMSWITDHFDDPPSGKPTAARTGTNWGRCAPISNDELKSLLVPNYIAALPPTDGWGHPFEYCLERDDVRSDDHFFVGVRSAGRDGRFEGADYVKGKFDPKQADRDIVWLDGYFFVWPER
jgi:hypothetical protein